MTTPFSTSESARQRAIGHEQPVGSHVPGAQQFGDRRDDPRAREPSWARHRPEPTTQLSRAVPIATRVTAPSAAGPPHEMPMPSNAGPAAADATRAGRIQPGRSRRWCRSPPTGRACRRRRALPQSMRQAHRRRRNRRSAAERSPTQPPTELHAPSSPAGSAPPADGGVNGVVASGETSTPNRSAIIALFAAITSRSIPTECTPPRCGCSRKRRDDGQSRPPLGAPAKRPRAPRSFCVRTSAPNDCWRLGTDARATSRPDDSVDQQRRRRMSCPGRPPRRGALPTCTLGPSAPRSEQSSDGSRTGRPLGPDMQAGRAPVRVGSPACS